MQNDLTKYNKKTWCKSALLGIFIGLAVIVPGISGSAVAIIFGLYEAMLYAMSNISKQFKRCFLFLLPIGIGLILGLLVGFFTVQKALEYIPFAIICCFAGLMSGAVPAITDELKNVKLGAKHIVLIICGLIIPITVSVLPLFISSGRSDLFSWSKIFLCVPVGTVIGVTQLVPGLSASAILMSIGFFTPLVESVSISVWQANHIVLLAYLLLAIGFVIGVFITSAVMTKIFARARAGAYSVITGLSVGSIIAMFLNVEVFELYRAWQSNGVAYAEVLLGVVLFVVGAVLAYLLVRYQRGKNKAEQANEVEKTEANYL